MLKRLINKFRRTRTLENFWSTFINESKSIIGFDFMALTTSSSIVWIHRYNIGAPIFLIQQSSRRLFNRFSCSWNKENLNKKNLSNLSKNLSKFITNFEFSHNACKEYFGQWNDG